MSPDAVKFQLLFMALVRLEGYKIPVYSTKVAFMEEDYFDCTSPYKSLGDSVSPTTSRQHVITTGTFHYLKVQAQARCPNARTSVIRPVWSGVEIS